jgi:hypothetical protein
MIGDLNPFPFQVGGGPSRAEAAYDVLSKMMGSNGYSADENSIDAEWRKSKTLGLTALATFDERATNQNFPHTATDHIVLFEEMLGIVPDDTKTDEERRQVVVPDYVGVPEAWYSALNEQIQRIDERASITIPPWSSRGTTMGGRAFGPMDPVPGFAYDTFGQNNPDFPLSSDEPTLYRNFTKYPASSDAHRIYVLFDIGSGLEPSRDNLVRTDRIHALLNEAIPSWVDFRVLYAIGFILDESLLDATGFGS